MPSTPVIGVDAAADPALGLALVHRDAGLTQGTRDRGAVQQVAGPDPQPPLRDDVEREPRGVLVELPDERVDLLGVEPRSGQRVEGGHDPGVRGVGGVVGSELLGQVPDVAGADVPRPRRPGHHERQVGGADPLGEQADLCVAEEQRGQAAVGQDGAAGHHGRRCRPAGERLPDGGTHDRAHRHLLRPQPHRPDHGARGRADRAWTRAGHLLRRPTRAAPPARRSPRCAATAPGSRPPSGGPGRPPPTYPGRPRRPARRPPPT